MKPIALLLRVVKMYSESTEKHSKSFERQKHARSYASLAAKHALVQGNAFGTLECERPSTEESDWYFCAVACKYISTREWALTPVPEKDVLTAIEKYTSAVKSKLDAEYMLGKFKETL